MYASQLCFMRLSAVTTAFQTLRLGRRIHNRRNTVALASSVIASDEPNREATERRQVLTLEGSKGSSARSESQLGKRVNPETLHPKADLKAIKDREAAVECAVARTCHENKEKGAILEISAENIEHLAVHSLELGPETGRESSGLRDFHLELSNLRSKAASRLNSEIKNRSLSNNTKPRSPLEVRKPADTAPETESWHVQKAALKKKFPEGWKPRKRLSPDALAGIRAIHSQFPEQFTTRVIAEKFAVSPEAVRRILKSNWTPKNEEQLDRQRRWISRGRKVWTRYSELGLKPPARWRRLGTDKSMDHAKGGAESGPKITVRGVDYGNGFSQKVKSGGLLADRIL